MKADREHRPSSQTHMIHYYSHSTLSCVFARKMEKAWERFFQFKHMILVILWQIKTENSPQKEINLYFISLETFPCTTWDKEQDNSTFNPFPPNKTQQRIECRPRAAGFSSKLHTDMWSLTKITLQWSQEQDLPLQRTAMVAALKQQSLPAQNPGFVLDLYHLPGSIFFWTLRIALIYHINRIPSSTTFLVTLWIISAFH